MQKHHTTLKSRARNSKIDLYNDIDKIKKALATITHDVKTKTASMVGESIENARDRSYDLQDNVDDYLSERPFKSIGVAMIAGAVIGYLLHSLKE